MSENDNCHCAGTTKVVIKVMGRNAWRGKPIEATLENRHRVCGRDMLGQDGQQQQRRPREGGHSTIVTKSTELSSCKLVIGHRFISHVRWICCHSWFRRESSTAGNDACVRQAKTVRLPVCSWTTTSVTLRRAFYRSDGPNVALGDFGPIRDTALVGLKAMQTMSWGFRLKTLLNLT